MKYLFICLFLLIGCHTTSVKTITVLDNCNSVTTLWWGEKGDDPSENDLWKCYPWILEAQ